MTYGLFGMINGDIYVNNGYGTGDINEWIWHMNTSVFVMTTGLCYGIFIDINDFLYCSISYRHQVIKKSLNNTANPQEIIVGTGCPGLTSNMLYQPQGIFVHVNLTLYVADCGNDRIQLFHNGTTNGITIAGNGAVNTIALNCPSDVALDGDAYLYIVDQNNHRIIGSGPNGYRCLVGCSGGGSASNQLNTPQSMAFDSHGNIFVTDQNNARIQKFFLETYSCGKCDDNENHLKSRIIRYLLGSTIITKKMRN